MNKLFCAFMIFLIGITAGYAWNYAATLPPAIEQYAPGNHDEAMGYKDGKWDSLRGAGFKQGFYNPPDKSVAYWRGYAAGWEGTWR